MGLMVEEKITLEGESIVCFAGEDWWYHHPHSKNHLLKRYALRNKVLFVNSISMGLPSMANPDFFLKIKRKLRSYTRWLRKVPEGLWVMTPVNLPLYGSRAGRWVNRILLVAQLRMAMLFLRITRPILWIAIPTAAEMAGRLGEKLLLYQVSDKYDANEDSALSAQVIRRYDRQLKDAADVVLYSGRKLFRESTEPHRFFLEQAVDFDHFSNLRVEPAPELEGIPDPILGYFGTMDYVMDTELMAEVARLRPGWHWVLLGLKSNLVRVSAPNIHFLGSKQYRDLPRYIRQFDCVRFALARDQHLHQLRERDQGTRISGHGKASGDGPALRIFGDAGSAFLPWHAGVHCAGRSCSARELSVACRAAPGGGERGYLG